MVAIDELEAILGKFDGTLDKGHHSASENKVSLLEAESVRLGVRFTDNPDAVRMFDLRALNDTYVSHAARTKHLLPVWQAYIGSLNWTAERKRAVAKKFVLLLVNRIVSRLPGLPEEISARCRAAATLEQAKAAAAKAMMAPPLTATSSVAAERAARAVQAVQASEEAAARAEEEAQEAEEAVADAVSLTAREAAELMVADAVSLTADAASLATEEAADAASLATEEAADAAREKVFIEACEIFIEAAAHERR